MSYCIILHIILCLLLCSWLANYQFLAVLLIPLCQCFLLLARAHANTATSCLPSHSTRSAPIQPVSCSVSQRGSGRSFTERASFRAFS